MVILFSGGMDSTTLIVLALSEGFNVNALGVLYGQRHKKELNAAAGIAQHLGVPYQQVDLSDLRRLWTGSSQTDSFVPVPHGHYAASSMKATVVPNRNLTMLAVAAGYALALSPDEAEIKVGFAAHAGDHAIYPDCRPEFVQAARVVFGVVDYRPVHLWTPFLHMTKTDIARKAAELNAPLHLTWSCYEGQELHCGRCGTCVERREAFELAGLPDPTTYGIL